MENKSNYTIVRIKILILLIFGFAYSMLAQKLYDYNWLFGYGTGIPDSLHPFGGIIMSFSNGQISFKNQARDFEFNYQTNSFSDKDGNLLYMSNGCSMANSSAKIIANGDSLGFGKIWGVNCPKYQPAVQAGIFINFLQKNKDSLIFLHSILDTIGNGMEIYRNAIRATEIDISSNSVFSKNKIILYDTLYGGGFTAIPNKDYQSWWIITPQRNNNKFWVLLYNSQGVQKSIEIEIGLNHESNGSGGAQGLFSPNGNNYAFYSSLNGLQVFNFDRNTGLLSKFRYYPLIYQVNAISGCSFSPDSRFVYVSNPTEVLQIDLLESDSTKSVDTIGVYDNFLDPYPTTYMQMALGPDCRIYITTGGGNRYLHVIMQPNKKGKECQLINRGLKLPTRNSFATPNFPHYRVDDPYPCDSTISIPLNTDVENEYKFKEGELIIYPNPASTVLYVHDIKSLIASKVLLRLIDLNGNVLFSQEYNSLTQEIKIPIHNLAQGMYFIQINDYKRNYWLDKFIKI